MSTASGTATAEERLVAEFLAAYAGGDADAVANLVTDDCVVHQVRWPKNTVGRDAVVAETASNEGRFADFAVRIEDAVVGDDRVAAYAVAGGRNVGPIRMEGREIAPTGRRFEVPQFGHYRLADGRIAEAWILADALGIVQQLDNFPAGPAAMVRIALRQLGWGLRGKPSLE
jgi:predicted ester cyclase